MTNLLTKLKWKLNLTVIIITLFAAAFCSNIFAFDYSVTKSSASFETGTFSFAVSELNTKGGGTISFSISGQVTTSVSSVTLTVPTIVDGGSDVILINDLDANNTLTLKNITISSGSDIRAFSGGEMEYTTIHGSVDFRGDGASNTIKTCDFIGGYGTFGSNYTLNTFCSYSNAVIILKESCKMNCFSTSCYGNNTLSLYDYNAVDGLGNFDVNIQGELNSVFNSELRRFNVNGDYNDFSGNTIVCDGYANKFVGNNNTIQSNNVSSITSSYQYIKIEGNANFVKHNNSTIAFFVKGDTNEFHYNTVLDTVDNSLIEKFEGDHNEVHYNTFASAMDKSVTILGTSNEFYYNNSFSNNIGLLINGDYNEVYGNIIGVSNVNFDVGNNQGIKIESGWFNKIGSDDDPSYQNFIAGNDGNGIEIEYGGNNEIVNNNIGLDVDDNNYGNSAHGIYLNNTVSNIIKGGNYISRNLFNGIYSYRSSVSEIHGNYIGVSPIGNNSGNWRNGIFLDRGKKSDVYNNEIAANDEFGIKLYQEYSEVYQNKVGAPGQEANKSGGIYYGSITNLMIGEFEPSYRNIIVSNDGPGIYITGYMKDSYIAGSVVGLLEDGTLCGNATGIYLKSITSGGMIIGTNFAENVICGSKGAGLVIDGVGGNILQNNYIGIDTNGVRQPNFIGVLITNSSDNIIGTANDEISRNYISGNDGNGLEFRDRCVNNIVKYNYIGVGLDGDNNVYNGGNGIFAMGHSSYDVEENYFSENIIGFNKKDGIHLGDDAEKNYVDGNFIGISSDAGKSIGNEGNGIFINERWNEIGLKSGNFIGGNGSNGILIVDSDFNKIRKNFIGVYITGSFTKAFPNLANGIAIVDGAGFNRIGETNTLNNQNYNIITANKGNGIYIERAGSDIQNNYIGMTQDKDLSIPVNGKAGIAIYKGSAWIGGLDAGKENYIVGKTGILIDDSTASLYRNNIGFSSGDTNVAIGIHVKNSENFSFGQMSGGHYNYIANANDAAILIENSTNITARAAIIGFDNLDNSVTNIGDGVRIVNSTNCTIQESYIAGSKIGVSVVDSDTIKIRDNYIGYKNPAQIEKGNREFGVKVSNGKNIRVEGENFISGNNGHGIELLNSKNSVVQYNTIGILTNETDRCGNKGDGIRLINSENIVVGDIGRNIIAGCGGNAVIISGGKNNEFSSNKIGVEKTGLIAITNAGSGIIIENSSDNEISQNIICGNGGDGVCISGSLSFANSLLANYVGIGNDIETIIPNKKCGVRIIDAPENFVGKPTWGNMICSSGDDGVMIEGVGSSNNFVLDNYIGISYNLKIKGNDGNGVHILDAANCAVSKNIICANGKSGLKIADSTAANLAKNNLIVNNDIGYYNNYNQANALDGIEIYKASYNYIGLSNVVSGNKGNGINISGFGAQDNWIIGNFIGVSRFNFPAPNYGHGVLLNGGDGNKVGFTNDWEKNIIAENLSNGVDVAFGIYNRILGNSIYDNGLMGINLGTQGRSSGDTPNVPNNYQTCPVLNGAYSGGVTRVVGSLSAKKNSTYLLEFYGTSNTNKNGYGEGKTFAGRNYVDTADDGIANFAVELDSSVQPGYIITATATATNGNTSEFSVPVWVASATLSANFAVDQTLVLTGAVINFTDMSAGIPSTYAWDFDNNGSTDSTDANPQHSYSSVGDKSVKLTVTDSGSSTIVKTNIIRVAGAEHSITNESDNIQNVIDSSAAYDIINLADGTFSQQGRTYNGDNILVLDNNITITGSDDPASPTILDGLGTMRCAYVISGRVVGITFQNGSATGAGANGQGGAAVCGEVGEIDRCKAMNSSATEGGGIFVNNGGVIKSCLIISNNATSGGGVIVASGGAAYNTTIADNQATTSAGGALCAGEMINNIVYYNTAPTDPNLTISVGTFTYGCTAPAKGGAGNISSAPAFLENYKIDESSPCAGAAVELDWMSWSKDVVGEPRLRGNEADMGAYSAIPEPFYLSFIIYCLLFISRRKYKK